MKFKINGQTEIFELELRDRNNICWLRDLMGNCGALDCTTLSDVISYDEDTGVYVFRDAYTADWWTERVQEQNALRHAEDAYAEEFGQSALHDLQETYPGCDLEYEGTIYLGIIAEATAERRK